MNSSDIFDLTKENAAVAARVGRWFGRGFVVAVILMNLLALVAAWQDQSWTALWIAIIAAPILNLVLALVSLSATPLLKRWRVPFSVGRHVALSFGAPIAATIFDFVAIISMPLHGC